MDQERFDQITKALAAGTSRRAVLRRLGVALGGALGLRATGSLAAPKGGNSSKCYGGGSQCTNGKQCCSGTCTNRQCTSEVPTVCAAGSTRSCYSGPAGTAGVGVCLAGLETCLANGSGFGPCVGQVLPTAEVCDGRDNDCDGVVDEGCPPVSPCSSNPLLGTPCTVGVGACERTGTVVCTADQQGVMCSAQPGTPTDEICGNGIDDDCDGVVDDGCETPCPSGYEREGTECVNIDECTRGTNNCSPNAYCTDTDGGFECACIPPYTGDGVTCLPE